MVLIVETGLIIPGANCYVDVATADGYFTGINDPAWAALPLADKERHIILGAQFVDNAQVHPFDGDMQSVPTQWMRWPRTGCTYWETAVTVPDFVVPIEVQRANLVAAEYSLTGQLPTTPGAVTPGGIEVKREKVDTLEIEYFHSKQGEGSDSSSAILGPATYGLAGVTGLLMPLLRSDALIDPNAPPTTVVPRNEAARRGAWYIPKDTPAAFNRAQHDANPFREDVLGDRKP